MSLSDDRWDAGDAYEAYMGRWSRPLALRFLDWLRPPSGADWLDVGCGTGALTSAIVARTQPTSVTACDPSEAFIDDARRRLDDPRVTFLNLGADFLPARDGGFDLAVSGLVLNFIPEPVPAVIAMRARLKPDGRVAAYVWDYADGMEFLRRFWDAAIALDPAAAPLDEGRRFRVCEPEALAAAFRSAGLTEVATSPLEIETVFASFEDYWRPFGAGTGPAPAHAASLDPERRDALRKRLEASVPTGADGRIRLRARAWAVVGTHAAR